MGEREERIAKARRQVADCKRMATDANHELVQIRLALVAEEKGLRQRLAAAEVAATAATRSDSRSTDAATEELATAQRLCSAWETEAGVKLGRAVQRAGMMGKALREAEKELHDALRSSEPPS